MAILMASKQFDPDYVVPTAEVLREWLDDHHMSTHVAVASYYAKGDSRDWAASVLDNVLDDAEVDEERAHVLEAVTGISMAFWTGFDHNYRAGLAAGKTVTHGGKGDDA